MKGRKLTLYLDTSVIGGYYDDEFSIDTSLEIHSPKELRSYENEEI
jgi:hypothetical protein